MRSDIPKVLHQVGGRSMLERVVDVANELDADKIFVVVGEDHDAIKQRIRGKNVEFIVQAQQLGTGHAVLQALPHIERERRILVLYGDVPLVRASTLRTCLELGGTYLTVLTAQVKEPAGYGRVFADGEGNATAIVEDLDLSDEQRANNVINSGILAGPAALFHEFLPQIKQTNAQNEIYLTDLVQIARDAGETVKVASVEDSNEVAGVNTRQQLALLEHVYQSRASDELMSQGVTLQDPNSVVIRGTVRAGIDCLIDRDVVLEGSVTLGSNVVIESHCKLSNVTLGDNVLLKHGTVVDGCQIGAESVLGPYARVRPSTRIGEGCHIGNFVEVKNSVLDAKVKAGHLAYIGDAYIGKETNFGAGAITCNYDGENKNRTVIGRNAFIGSNASLVAPIVVGDYAHVAAGTVDSKKTVPEGAMAIARSDLRILSNWRERFRVTDTAK